MKSDMQMWAEEKADTAKRRSSASEADHGCSDFWAEEIEMFDRLIEGHRPLNEG